MTKLEEIENILKNHSITSTRKKKTEEYKEHIKQVAGYFVFAYKKFYGFEFGKYKKTVLGEERARVVSYYIEKFYNEKDLKSSFSNFKLYCNYALELWSKWDKASRDNVVSFVCSKSRYEAWCKKNSKDSATTGKKNDWSF